MEGVARKIFNGNKPHLDKIVACIAIVAFMVMMLVKPDYYLDSARRGLSLYATTVLPALFPFYFFSLLLTYIGAAKTVSGIFQKPVKLLYNAPKESAYVLLLSMISGYPVGASMTSELYLSGVITEKEAKSVAAFASTSGPLFMLGTVGTAIFNDIRAGIIILIAHYLAAIINGIIFKVRNRDGAKRPRFLSGKRTLEKNPEDTPVRVMSKTSQDDVMSRTIANSTLSMLYVGGYIVLCGMLVDTLSLIDLEGWLAGALGTNAAQPIIALLYGLIEMTRGSIACAECATPHLSIALCAAIVSFGGLSVTLQNYTFLSKCNMKFAQIVIRKFTQCVIAFAIAFALTYVF